MISPPPKVIYENEGKAGILDCVLIKSFIAVTDYKTDGFGRFCDSLHFPI